MLNFLFVRPGTVPGSALLPVLSQKHQHLVQGVRGFPTMKHGMTIGTYGPKILDGIDLVLRSNLRQRNEMMNMRKIDHYFPVLSNEIKTAEEACRSVMLDAFRASAVVA